MPYADPEDKKAWAKTWKERTKQNGYNKWLYARRKLRFVDAREFRGALERIATGEFKDPAQVARRALNKSNERHAALGSPPKVEPLNGDIHRDEEGDTLAEALAKLGLT